MVNKRSYARADVYKAATIKVRAEWEAGLARPTAHR